MRGVSGHDSLVKSNGLFAPHGCYELFSLRLRIPLRPRRDFFFNWKRSAKEALSASRTKCFFCHNNGGLFSLFFSSFLDLGHQSARYCSLADCLLSLLQGRLCFLTIREGGSIRWIAFLIRFMTVCLSFGWPPTHL